MTNVFFEQGSHAIFSWEKLGNIKDSRGELGEDMPVLVYRLFAYCMNDILHREYGFEIANELFRKAGHLAGCEFAKNALPLDKNMDEFVYALQDTLKMFKIGILRIEKFDPETGEFVLTVAEDLDCSGLPPTNEVVCNYDEGFISGIMEMYTGKPYHVREINCWANGDRVCRFRGEVIS